MPETPKENHDFPEASATKIVLAKPVDPVIESAENPPRGPTRVLVWFTLALILIGLLWFFYWLFYLQYHESTDDAYANGNKVNINSAVSGSVIAFFADDTDLVKEGQLLILLDRTEFQMTFEKELASLASVVLQVKQMYDSILVNKAIVENKKAVLSKVNFDYVNRSQLIHSEAVSNEEFVHSKDDLRVAQHDLQQAESQLQSALDAVGKTPLEKHPLIEQQRANVRTAFYNLKHCEIYAPATGNIAQRSVEVGQWVTPTLNLMAIIPQDYVWVDANYKETQLRNMRIGQPATVWFDLYGSKVKYEGKVLGIASGSGSVFSLIPPQNATGNWIKIVQRLPVRISLDPKVVKQFPIRIGISAEVDVDVTNLDLPMLAQIPIKKSIATTNVFDISLEEINKMMDEIIHVNLSQSHE
jgi:membrane fusion protein, multidrug efflux system